MDVVAKTKNPTENEYEFEITITAVFSKRITVIAKDDDEAAEKAQEIVDNDGEGIDRISIDAPESWSCEETRDVDGPI